MREDINGLCAPSGDNAKKFDQGKPPLSRIPKQPLEQIAQVLAFGATKYGWDNWKQGLKWSRPLDACLRHLYKFANKEDLDDESRLNHLAHAACNLIFLMYYYENDLGEDDR
jgi:hypothetical protein